MGRFEDFSAPVVGLEGGRAGSAVTGAVALVSADIVWSQDVVRAAQEVAAMRCKAVIENEGVKKVRQGAAVAMKSGVDLEMQEPDK